jgi:hypothetical protein
MDRQKPPSAPPAQPPKTDELSSRRLEAFLREAPRDGNIAILLPDCEPNIKLNRKQKRIAARKKIDRILMAYKG